MFKESGAIYEVFITLKRDKKGMRYVFCRFEKVEDVCLIAIELDSIIIRRRKIHPNIPRLKREEQVRDHGNYQRWWEKKDRGNEKNATRRARA